MPSQGRNLTKRARIEVGQLSPDAAGPGTRSRAQKHPLQKITPTDPTRPPSSTRTFAHPRARRVRAGWDLPTLGRAMHTLERARGARRAAGRRGTPLEATAAARFCAILRLFRVFAHQRTPVDEPGWWISTLGRAVRTPERTWAACRALGTTIKAACEGRQEAICAPRARSGARG